MSIPAALLFMAFVALGPAARADVVLNEILYRAPDDLHDLQFIELHNTGDKPVDLSGWKLKSRIQYEFPARTSIEANGYLVVCKNLKEFKKYYGFDAGGPFEGSLDGGKDPVELTDAAGKKIDAVMYRSRAPWPVAPDGYSSSLERICPTSAETGSDNWAPSPLPAGTPKPGGTPGKKNANHTTQPPPIIANVTFTPTNAIADQEVKVEGDIRSGDALRTVELLYRVAGSGYEREEKSIEMKSGKKARYSASIPAQKAGQILRFRIRAVDVKGGERFFPHQNEVRPALSVYVHDKFEVGKIPLGFVINVSALEFRAAPTPTPPARGKSAFVYVNQKTGAPELFDFINVTPRNGGHKVRFHKDHLLDGMKTINLIFEYMDRFVLAEPLAYEVYRKAGNAAPRSDHVRTWIDGRPLGYQLLVEQPNSAFLRHNKIRSDGNLYKLIWYGQGLVGQHEKKTNIHGGHDDLVKLVGQLNKLKGDDQWTFIKKHFDVEQMINYFAANMILSHWDGFHNNYFLYHDINGSKKWTMHPWDQDKTWGLHDGINGYEVFTDMPITFGMAGDRPPGWPRNVPPPPVFGGGPIWWRPAGHLSGPLLANGSFRKLFLARTKELLEKVYTEDEFFPRIKAMGERLEDEVKVRAELRREDPKRMQEHLRRNLASLREHLVKRRKYLLEQDEIKKAGKFDRTELK